MATPAGLKNIRVALIQGSKITEDRTLKRRVPVSVGTDEKNTFVVPVSNLPRSFTLFELIQGQYSLVFQPGMEGRVQVGGVDVTLAQAIEQNLAKARGAVFVLPLNDASRGKVALGEISLLFQFVTPPSEPAKIDLPPGVKGSFFKQLDPLFFMTLGVSLFVHFSGAGYIACQPMPEERELTLDELPDRFVKAMMPVEIKKPEKKVEVADTGADKKEKKEEVAAKGEEKPAKGSPEAKAQLQARVASKGLLKIIGSAGGGGGAFDDLVGSSAGVGDIANALAGAGGVGIATADSLAAGGPKGGTAGSAATIGDLGTSGGGNVALGEKAAVQVRGKVADATPEVESADVDREKLASYVRSRKAAIQNCYEKELKRNPSLKGKVVVRFSITPQGRTTDIDIEENTLGNEAVSSCIKTVIRGWVFPFKPPSEVPVAYPFVFSPAS
jgi:TonB family protein